MSVLFVALLVVFVAGVLLAVFALVAPRKATQPDLESDEILEREPLTASTDWSREAVEEFSGLSESARCDMIFAVGALDDDRSHQLMVHALDDPSDAVALAAAHALAQNGRMNDVRSYAERHPGPRAETLLQRLALLD